MSFGKIITYSNNPRVHKALIAAKLNNLDVTTQSLTTGVDNATPEYKRKFPTGQVPAFEGADGFVLFDSDAITQYIAESGPQADRLLGATPAERATIRQWIAFASSDLMPVATTLFLPIVGVVPFDAALHERTLPSLHKNMGILENWLKDRTYLVSEKEWNLADLSVLSAVWWVLAWVLKEEEQKKYPAFMKWFERLLEDPAIKEVFGDAKNVKKPGL
ncbi:hypothetical protein KEM56_006733 [Ascosphaera pollenicola]|nr:hypothetical protein KEM56_006733 [Ascosphaera pollenicola]